MKIRLRRASGRDRGAARDRNPLLQLRLPAYRSRLVLSLLALGFVALAGRAAYLQLLTNDFLRKQGEARYERSIKTSAPRGKILDRRGEVLAASVAVRAVWAVPGKVRADSRQLDALAALLKIDRRELDRRLESDEPIPYIARQLDVQLADRIASLGIRGLQIDKEYRRHYPNGEAVAHLVGYTDRWSGTGLAGIELVRDRALAGKPGNRRVIQDLNGNVVEDVRAVVEPVDGHDVRLSIDSRVQFHAFEAIRKAVREHRARSGSAVVVDARTGGILALANWPSFDPMKSRPRSDSDVLRNAALGSLFEPGSTMKPFTVALALEHGKVRKSTVIDTAPGRIRIGTATIGDAHRHGPLTVEQVIQKSSNIGTAKIALQMSPHEMWEFLDTLGFGQSPRIGAPGAAAGRLRAYRRWRPIEQATMSYGHGLSVSLVQLAHAYTVFARGGELVPLTLAPRDEPVEGARVLSPATVSAMLHMLELAVGPQGTAPKAQIAGYRVAGKTGTAHKVQDGRYVKKYVAAFAGVVPASNPRVVIAVMVDEPRGKEYYGGDVAAPVFAKIAAETMRELRVPPDAPLAALVVPAKAIKESM